MQWNCPTDEKQNETPCEFCGSFNRSPDICCQRIGHEHEELYFGDEDKIRRENLARRQRERIKVEPLL